MRSKFRQSLHLLKTYQQRLDTPEASPSASQTGAVERDAGGEQTTGGAAAAPVASQAERSLRESFPRAAAAYDEQAASPADATAAPPPAA